ncbi:MAG: hypothetical protein V2A79_09835 [Planctomycetota bacterium]
MTKVIFASRTGKSCSDCRHYGKATLRVACLVGTCGNKRSDNYGHAFAAIHPSCPSFEDGQKNVNHEGHEGGA